ncbi:MAG: thiopeptide-type bacteriocin biosynthesis protein [Psychroserpens sp.]|jgi:thiopeptide-type bacteriocin biosynthesis protein
MIEKTVDKTFSIGTEWIYYKIYCGVKTADEVLLQVIKPICTSLLKDKCIDKWFFIRYADPDPHLRLRFHITCEESISKIILMMRDSLDLYLENRQIWDVQLATYQRELERYGTHTMTSAESVFFYDSEQVLCMIEQSANDEERLAHAFHWVEELIRLFQLADIAQIAFLERMQQQFKEEFEVKKQTTKQLNLKYKNLEARLFQSSSIRAKQEVLLSAVIKSIRDAEKNNLLDVSLEDLISSYIHMSINRIFRSQQRLHEMLIYSFLYKKHKSKMARYGRL